MEGKSHFPHFPAVPTMATEAPGNGNGRRALEREREPLIEMCRRMVRSRLLSAEPHSLVAS